MTARASSVRRRLARVMLFAALPVLLLAAAGSVSFWRIGLGRALADVAAERDRTVAINMAAIDSAAALLRGLALALEADPEACAQVLSVAASGDLHLSLHDATGRAPCAMPGGDGAAATAAPALVLTQPAAGGTLRAVLAPRAGRPDALHWLFDDAGRKRGFGPLPVPADPPAPQGNDAFEAMAGDGTALLVATGELTPGIGIAVALPAAPLRRTALRLALLHFAEIVALLAFSGTAVLVGTTRAVTTPLRGLRDAVMGWRAGAPDLDIPDEGRMPAEMRDLAASIRDARETLARRETELRAAIGRAELLAGEVHHRVKNNLQTVSSLLALQAHRVADPAARNEFEAARDRVGALATLHRHLYAQHDPEAIDLAAFIGELGAQLFAAVGERPGRRIALHVAAPALRLSTDQAVPLALVITEAVADALRQGFSEARHGRICITLEATGDQASLVIEDDGALPRAPDPLRAMLLRGLGRQLGGEMRVEGGRVALTFRLRPAASRPPPSVSPPRA
ncbi:sensor histidine kinase [Falsiroseomonas sp. CW058]|uniref:sensor histidine kinase n=1 Tax=Falsiroseomonas sp. CW058 TaxID=3388664 RepID=UPI003D31364F